MREKLGKCPIPVWLFAVVTAVYCESLLHLWTMKSFDPGRFAAVLAFALGFGGILGLILSFIGEIAQNLEVDFAHVEIEHISLASRHDITAVTETFTSGAVRLHSADEIGLKSAATHLVNGGDILVVGLERFRGGRLSSEQRNHRAHAPCRISHQIFCAAYLRVSEDMPSERR